MLDFGVKYRRRLAMDPRPMIKGSSRRAVIPVLSRLHSRAVLGQRQHCADGTIKVTFSPAQARQR